MRVIQQDEKLYRAFGVLWMPYTNDRGNSWLLEKPLCTNDTCHTFLEQRDKQWYCIKCEKFYPCKNDYVTDNLHAQKMWEGHKTLDWEVYSLELPPTKIKAGDEDDNYWVKVQMLEKGGKRFAVAYFGEKVRGEQDKTDYAQVFLDLEDEQMRFDKNNKNPMRILCKSIAEFQESSVEQKKKSV